MAHFSLDNPVLGTQYERQPGDSYRRNLTVLRRYAKTNGFDGKLNKILMQYGGQEVLDLSSDELDPSTHAKPAKDTAVKLKRSIDAAQVGLKREIEAGRKGVKPFLKKIRYTLKDKSGRSFGFVLDPDQRAHRTLQQFEIILSKHSAGQAMEAQFLPAFQEIRREMVRWGWDKGEASTQATLLAIKQLCDTWAQDVS